MLNMGEIVYSGGYWSSVYFNMILCMKKVLRISKLTCYQKILPGDEILLYTKAIWNGFKKFVIKLSSCNDKEISLKVLYLLPLHKLESQ